MTAPATAKNESHHISLTNFSKPPSDYEIFTESWVGMFTVKTSDAGPGSNSILNQFIFCFQKFQIF